MSNLSRRSLARYGADRLLAGVSSAELSKELASVLISSKMEDQAKLLASDILRELEDRSLLAGVSIYSAHDLPAKLNQQISDFVKKTVKVDKVVLHNQVDPRLIGGVRIETANHAWDSTVSKKIDDMRKVF